MPDSMFFELNADQGLAPDWIVDHATGLEVPNPHAGEPSPLNNIGIQIPTVAMAPDGEVIETTTRQPITPSDRLDEVLRARILPGTRIVETDHPAVANLLNETGLYHQIDPPRSEQPHRPKNTTTSDLPAGKEH